MVPLVSIALPARAASLVGATGTGLSGFTGPPLFRQRKLLAWGILLAAGSISSWGIYAVSQPHWSAALERSERQLQAHREGDLRKVKRLALTATVGK